MIVRKSRIQMLEDGLETKSGADHTHSQLHDRSHDHAGVYSPTGHDHDAAYSAIAHDHDADYSGIAHDHDAAYSAIAHDHSGVYSPAAHDHSGVYSPASHDHDADYSDIAHDHALVYSPIAHDHALLYSALAHDHSGVYSPAGHDHDAAYSGIAHNHTGVYSEAAHNHSGTYSEPGHAHAGGDITSGTISTDRFSAYADLGAEAKIGTGATQVAAGDHNHSATYSALAHDHAGVYSATGHDHDAAYSAIAHDHSGVYSPTAHNHDAAYSAIAHDHTGVYSPSAHDHAGVYAPTSHAHAGGDITSGTISTDRFSAHADLVAESKIGTGSTQVAAGDHNHDAAYSATSHNHSGVYAPTSHAHSGADITSGTVGTDYFSAHADLVAESKIGTGSTQVAAGDHAHVLPYDVSAYKVAGASADFWYGPMGRTATLTTLALTANRVYAIPFPCPVACNVKDLGFYVSTYSNAGNANLCIYADTGNVHPGVKVYESGSVAIGATGLIINTPATPVALSGQSLYWLVFLSDVVNTIKAVSGSDLVMHLGWRDAFDYAGTMRYAYKVYTATLDSPLIPMVVSYSGVVPGLMCRLA